MEKQKLINIKKKAPKGEQKRWDKEKTNSKIVHLNPAIM